MGELIEVSTLTDLAPGMCRQVDAGGRPVALFNGNGTIYGILAGLLHNEAFAYLPLTARAARWP